MVCAQCNNRNPIGNKFCRECGAKLPVPESGLAAEEAERADRERKQERVAALLSQAFRLTEERKYAEALLIAEEASAILPDSTSTLALMATLYERLGKNDEAISIMEKVVELNPDSAADQAKLSMLRKGIHIPAAHDRPEHRRDETPPLPWIPLVAAGGAMAIVLGIGMGMINRNGSRTPPPPTPTPVAAPNPMSPMSPTMPGTATMPSTPSVIGAPQANIPTPNPAGSAPFVAMAPPTTHRPTPSAPPPTRPAPRQSTGGNASSGMTLPRPSDIAATGGSNPSMVAPVTVSPPRPITPPNSGNGVAGGDFGNGGRLNVGPPTNPPQSPPEAAPTPPPYNGGYIRIQVGGTPKPQNPPAEGTGERTPNTGSGSSEATPSPNESTMNRARRLQSGGRYAEAVRAYQAALNEGMDAPDAAEAHQAIAQCYARLGDEGSARTFYREAIRGYENQISAGRNAGVARQGIVTCRAALEALGTG
jgi:tetratricopeptide (TPR) repeat protein